MDAIKKPTAAMMKRDPNAKIKVEFDRAPLSQRLKAKYLSLFFLKKVVWFIFRLILLIGIAYTVLYPFITIIAGSFMSAEDFVDVTVLIVPKHFTFDTYTAVFNDFNYMEAFINTFMLSIACAVLQTFACALVAYGIAKFKFKGAKVIFALVILTMIIPHRTLYYAMTGFFASFDIRDPITTILGGKGIFELLGLTGDATREGGIMLINTFFPLIILSVFGLAFKNGLYIFLLRQFFRGVPDELEESAYIDGSGTFKTFFKIILPLSVPMLITVFLFSFSWQWTDSFYTNLFFKTDSIKLLPKLITKATSEIPSSLTSKAEEFSAGMQRYKGAIVGTCGIMIIMPLVIIYVFCQKYLVQGIERSGLTAD